MTGVDGKAETLAIPSSVRTEVNERDGKLCRVCGAHVEEPALHHVRYRSEGGLHVPENLVTVHWMYAPRCHEMMHANKGRWQPVLLYVARTPGVTAFQVARWLRVGSMTVEELEQALQVESVTDGAGQGVQ